MCRDQLVNKGTVPSMLDFSSLLKPQRMSRMGRYHQGTRSLSNDYIVTDKVLGKGTSGDVCEAFAVSDRTNKVALKEFSISKLTEVGKSHLLDELAAFLSLDHPHVARLIDVYENDDKVSLVMECIEGGLLFSRVQEKKRFNELEAADAMRQILLAVSYLHGNGIAHRDLKLENIMYDAQDGDHLKLIDFGFSSFYRRKRMKTVCGTLSYVAPEVFMEDYYGSECDLWSAGVIAFILLTGSMPFYGSKEDKVASIIGGHYHMKPEKWDPLSFRAKHFVQSLLESDPEARLDAKAALAHPWIVEFGQGNVGKKCCPFTLYDTANALISWRRTPRFLQACFTVMAWNLSKEEHAKVRDYFTLFDKDMNGSVSLEELASVMRDECGVDKARLKKAFSGLSSIGDEEIEYSSFIAALLSKRIIDVDESLLQTTFSKFDETNKGFITRDDFKNAVGDRYLDASTAVMSAMSGGVSYDGFLQLVTTLLDDGKTKLDGSNAKGSCQAKPSNMFMKLDSTQALLNLDRENKKTRAEPHSPDSQSMQNPKSSKASQKTCCTLM